MHSRFAGSCIALLLLGGCASYKPTATPVEQVTDSQLVFNAEGYGAKVEPYLDKARQQQYFNADFNKAGYLVVDVVVKNEGKDPVEVRPYDIYLVFPGGTQMSPMEGKVVATQIEENGSVVGSILMFGLVGGIVATQAEHDAKNARILDYGGKELKETTLAPGASTQGYLFYRWTPSASAQAEFVLQLQDRTSNQLTEVTVPYENTKVFAVPQNALFTASPPPAIASASPGATQTASSAGATTAPALTPAITTASVSAQPQANLTTAATPSGPVNVPFQMQVATDDPVQGVGTLSNGALVAHGELHGKPFDITGEIKGDGLSITASGFLCVGHDVYGQGRVSGSGSGHPATGRVSIVMIVTCAGTNNISVTAAFDLPH